MLVALTALALAVLAGAQDACGPAYANSGATATLLSDPDADFCAFTAASDLASPRGLIVVGDAAIVVEISKGSRKISAHHFPNPTATSFQSTTVLDANGIEPNLNHGIAYYGGYLYASSETTVYRWAWNGDRASLPLDAATQQVVIVSMPTLADSSVNRHRTRTLLFSDSGDLYVSVGSEKIDDTDPDPFRARILKYPSAVLGGTSVEWTTGESVALGTRNAVAIGLRGTTLYSVDNGQGEIIDDRFGGNITPDHPAERINRHDVSGRFFGYPYCWTVGAGAPNALLPPTLSQVLYNGFLGTGTVYSPSDFGVNAPDSNVNQAFCDSGVEAPIGILPAHSAALGLLFQKAPLPGAPYAFPAKWAGSAFVFEHGSFDRLVPVGYRVKLLEMNGSGDIVAQKPFMFRADRDEFADSKLNNKGKRSPGNGFRPVTGDWLPDGSMVFSSDKSDELIVVRAFIDEGCEEE